MTSYSRDVVPTGSRIQTGATLDSPVTRHLENTALYVLATLSEDLHTMSLDVAMCALKLSSAPQDVITAVLATMGLKQRFTCALVCRAWARAAATRTLDLRRREDVLGLQQWLEKYGNQLTFLCLCTRRQGTLTTLPCAQLQDLQLTGGHIQEFHIASSVWSDIAAATKLTYVQLEVLHTESTPAEVMSVLARLPGLQWLMLHRVAFSGQYFGLREEHSLTLQQLTQITHLTLCDAQPSALRDIIMLGQLRSLIMCFPLGGYNLESEIQGSLFPYPWPSISCSKVPGLTALTYLMLHGYPDIPPAVSQMTALQQLEANVVQATALHQLGTLPGLTRLQMGFAPGYTTESAPPQLPAMRDIHWYADPENVSAGQAPDRLSMSFFDGCTQLQKLSLQGFHLRLRADCPGSWVASITLQHLNLGSCSIVAAEGNAGPLAVPWQQVFTAPGQMGQLTTLWLPCRAPTPPLSLADGECMVDCCSRLQVLTGVSPDVLPALVRLPHLTHLGLTALDDFQCSSLVQLTGLMRLDAAARRPTAADQHQL